MTLLSVENIAKQYPSQAEPLQVLSDVSLHLQAGQNLAIIGPSGSGKSTLLHVMGGLDPPTTGRVMIDQRDPYALAEPELALFRNQHIGFVFQDHHLLPQLSVLENVLIPVMARGAIESTSQQRAQMLLERVGLQTRLNHRPAELSGGERQRVAVARALICRPMLLLADEPTGNLDRTNARAVVKLLLELQQSEKAMLVMVTHSAELAGMMQGRMELDQGRLRPVDD